eukprot:Nk52_evm5s621 gene=Nk52_evmTU5s621
MGCGSSSLTPPVVIRSRTDEDPQLEARRESVKVLCKGRGVIDSYQKREVNVTRTSVDFYLEGRLTEPMERVSLKLVNLKLLDNESLIRITKSNGDMILLKVNKAENTRPFFENLLAAQKDSFRIDSNLEGSINKQILELKRKRAKEGNDVCWDCGHNDPEWLCFREKIFLCIECAGTHRSLDSHRVKSVFLDKWDQTEFEVALEANESKGNHSQNTEKNSLQDASTIERNELPSVTHGT